MKKDNLFKIIFCILMLIYLSLYFAGISGYYEYRNYKKMILTEEQINQFEEDVKEGKEINVEDYIVEEKNNHNNKIANAGKKLSFIISSSMSKVLTKCFKAISSFITE